MADDHRLDETVEERQKRLLADVRATSGGRDAVSAAVMVGQPTRETGVYLAGGTTCKPFRVRSRPPFFVDAGTSSEPSSAASFRTRWL